MLTRIVGYQMRLLSHSLTHSLTRAHSYLPQESSNCHQCNEYFTLVTRYKRLSYSLTSFSLTHSFILEQKTSLQGVWLYILCKLFKSEIINSKITSTICAYRQLTHSLIDSLHPSLTYFSGTLAYSDPNIPHRVCITCANTLSTQQNDLRYQLSRANKGIELIYSLILTIPSLTRNV